MYQLWRGTLAGQGGTQYPNTVRKIGKYRDTVMCQKSTKYRYLIYDRSRLLKAVSIPRVCSPLACMHQKATSDMREKGEKILIGRTIENPGHWMPFQFRHRLCSHLPLSLKS